MKTTTPTNSIRSADALLADASQYVRDNSVHWSVSRNISKEIAFGREKEEVKEIVEASRLKAPSLGLFPREIEGGFQVPGFGFVATLEDIKKIAKENGRAFIKLGEEKIYI